MKLVTKSIIAVATILASSAANAAVVRCKEALKKNAPVIVEFGYQNTSSARLQGPISINGAVVPSFQVAQYKVTGTDLFLLVDDDTFSKPVQTFTAIRSGNNAYLGTLVSVASNGKSATKIVECKVSAN